MDKKQLIEETLERAVDKIYPSKQALQATLLSGNRKLKIYLGVDPTGPHLHLGHATNLLTLKRLQELGHKIIFLIGDFTGQIGDPSDKLAVRKSLTEKEVKSNLKTFKSQASKVLSFSGKNAAVVKFNSTWHKKLSFADILQLAKLLTVQQMLKRDMFKKRIAENKPIGLHEFLYPLMQGYDSVAMNVDMEIGGTDQTFNMLVGRDLIEKLKHKEKFVLTTKLLENPKTGKKLMNKSEGGLINLDDKPKDVFGKTMALPDEAIVAVAKLSTEMPLDSVKQLKNMGPRDAKLETAFWVVKLCHGEKAAKEVKEEWIRTFSKKELPTEIPELNVPHGTAVMKTIRITGSADSNSATTRLIEQGGVKINDEVVKDPKKIIKDRDILKIGKRKIFRIKEK